MNGKAIHRCLHVLDLQKSLDFYEQALGMPIEPPEHRKFDKTLLAKVHTERF